VDLDPYSTWLLFRLQEQSPISQEDLVTRLQVPADQLMSSIEALLEKGLVTTTAVTAGQAGDQLQLTAAGQETTGKLETAYHDSLAELLDGWSPEQEEELASLLRRVATTLFSEEHKKELISSPAL
jgi:DNA-binding MarR family transcriptional regulator